MKKLTNMDLRAMELYREQPISGLTNDEIGEMLNREFNTSFTESKWRKMYKYGVEFYDQGKVDGAVQMSYDKSIMIINDVHLPYERPDVLGLINKHRHEITHLVIAGDLMDCKSISFFGKIDDINLEEEMIYAHKWLSQVRDILGDTEIIIINGNHEERWTTEIKMMNQKNMQKFINPNILEMLINGFTLYDDNGKTRTYGAIDNITLIPHWFVNINDKLLVAHPKNYSQVDGKMCENVVAHFINREEQFDLVVFGHTHKYSEMKVSRRGGKYAVENGCLCLPSDYADRGKLNFTPQDYCYTIVKWNDDEPINPNNINVYHLDEIEDTGQRIEI